MKAETVIARPIIDAVNASGLAEVWRNHSGAVAVKRGYMHLSPVGAPDIVGFARDGRFVGLEVKVPKAKTEKERAEKQREYRERIIASGGIAAEITTPEEAIAVLRGALEGRAA
jgi:hypothetical protein